MQIIMKLKKRIKGACELIVAFSRDTVKYIADALAKGRKFDAAVFLAVLVLVYAMLILIGVALVKLATYNLPIIIVVGILAICILKGGEPAPPRKPTQEDYQAVLTTIRPAVATVAQALGLAPIYSNTNMEADAEEQILPWGKVWRLKYKALKQKADALIDTDFARSVIQSEVKTVLTRDNPSGFSNLHFVWHGTTKPIIQIDQIENDGRSAYIYIYAVISDYHYFKQKSEWDKKKDALPTKVNIDDEDF